MKSSTSKIKNLLFILKLTCLSFLLTAVFLLILTFIVYKTYMNDKNIAIGIIIIYALTNIICGFIAGKIKKNKKYLWGAIIGISYLVLLSLISLIVTKEFLGNNGMWLPATLATILGGTFGGMIS